MIRTIVRTVLLAGIVVMLSYGNEFAIDHDQQHRWATLDEACRGGLGDDPATHAACRQRDAMPAGVAARFLARYCPDRASWAAFDLKWVGSCMSQ